jgi:hypothetical protein
MPHAGNAHFHDSFGFCNVVVGRFELDAVHLGFGDKPGCVSHRIFDPVLKGAERHVGNHHCPVAGSGNRGAMKHHHIHGGSQGVGMTVNHHGAGISHKDHVDTRIVYFFRCGVIIGGQHGDGFVVVSHRLNCFYGVFCHTFLLFVFYLDSRSRTTASASSPPTFPGKTM